MRTREHRRVGSLFCAGLFFGMVCAEGAEIVITQQPQSITVFERRKAMFGVEADGNGAALSYQWQRDGTDIAGANDSALITDYVQYSDTGDKFRVVISGPGLETVTSQEATLTVIGWDVPPQIIHAGRRTPDSAEIVVVFSTRVSAIDAGSLANWTLDGGATVKEVTAGRSESEFVVATENLAAGANYNLTARNIRDWAGNALREQTIAVTLASPDPALSVTQIANGLKISWRVPNYLYDPFALEFSSNVARLELWYQTGVVTTEGDLRTCVVDLNSKARFFRLRRVE